MHGNSDRQIDLSGLRLGGFTHRARTNASQVVVGIDSGAVTILPSKLDGIVTNGMNLLEFHAGDGIELYSRAMPLTKGAVTITAQILLVVLSDMAVAPTNTDPSLRLHMINLGWIGRFHKRSLQFYQAIPDSSHKTNLGTVDEIGSRTHVGSI